MLVLRYSKAAPRTGASFAARRWWRVDAVAIVVLAIVGLWPGVGYGRAARLGFALVEDATPSRMCPSEARTIAIELANTGDLGWQPTRADKIAYHWRTADGTMVTFDGERTELPDAIAPGQRLAIGARLVAPPNPGAYRLEWAMVREGVRWYPPGAEPIAVQVAGDRAAFAWSAALIDLAAVGESWGAGETIDLPVALRNDGCAAWDPALGDALAYRWRDAETDAVVVDEGRRTPLPATASGQIAQLVARIEAPLVEGRYTLELRPVREHLAWFPDAPHAERPRITVGPSPLRWSYQLHEPWPPIAAIDRVDIAMTVKNEGTLAWSHHAGDRLSYRIVDEHGAVVVAEGLRTPLPNAVAPGESARIDARFAAPRDPGRYTVHWQMVREDERWFGPPVSGPVATEIEVGPPRLAWRLVTIDIPTSMWSGRTRTIKVKIENVGGEAWSRDRGDRLSYRWRDADGRIIVGDGERTSFRSDVPPGATVTVAMTVRGPPGPGRHQLEIDLVREHETWFGGARGEAPPIAISVHRLADLLLVLLGVLVLALVVVRRELARRRPAIAAWLDALVVPIWTALAIGLLSEAFVDFSGVEMWPKARGLSWSGAMLLALPIWIVPKTIRSVVAVGGVTLLTLLALADLGYLHFFGSIVPLTALAAVHHLGDAHQTVASLMRPEYAWLSLLPLSGIVLVLAWPRVRIDLASRRRRLAPLVFAVAALPAVMRLWGATTGELGTRVFSEQNNVGRLGLVNAHLFELSRGLAALVSSRPALTDESRARIDAFFAERASARHVATPGTGIAAGSNVLLIQVEALQQWVVDARVGDERVMPFLSAASQSAALRFDRIHDQTAQGRTSDAEYLTLSSGHPLRVGALCFLRADNRFYTLAHALSDRGYATLSAHPYKRGFWNRAVLHPRYGFARSLFERELGDGPVIGWGLADSVFFERLVPQLRALPEPFFAFAITLSLHHPYDDFPDAFEVMDLGDLNDTRIGNYLHAMRHIDDALRRLLDDLQASDLLSRTIVVVYGDHVSRLEEPAELLALAEMDDWDPSAPMRLRKIPVVVWVPDAARHELVGQRSTVGGQIDIAPTILDLLGHPDAMPAAVGQSLLSDPEGFAALPDGSAARGDRIFVDDGRDIPRGGACFEARSGAARPMSECKAIVERARDELEISRLVLDHDLHRELRAGTR